MEGVTKDEPDHFEKGDTTHESKIKHPSDFFGFLEFDHIKKDNEGANDVAKMHCTHNKYPCYYRCATLLTLPHIVGQREHKAGKEQGKISE